MTDQVAMCNLLKHVCNDVAAQTRPHEMLAAELYPAAAASAARRGAEAVEIKEGRCSRRNSISIMARNE
jgi:hypothetical protein